MVELFLDRRLRRRIISHVLPNTFDSANLASPPVRKAGEQGAIVHGIAAQHGQLDAAGLTVRPRFGEKVVDHATQIRKQFLFKQEANPLKPDS